MIHTKSWKSFLDDTTFLHQGFECPTFVWLDVTLVQFEYLRSIGHIWSLHRNTSSVRLAVCEPEFIDVLIMVLEKEEFLYHESMSEFKVKFDTYCGEVNYQTESFLWWTGLNGHKVHDENSNQYMSLVVNMMNNAVKNGITEHSDWICEDPELTKVKPGER